MTQIRPPAFDKRTRERVEKDVSRRYIDSATRAARIEAAMKIKGFHSLNSLAVAMGVHGSSLKRSISAKMVSLDTVLRLTVVLGVPLSYLTDKEYKP